MFTHVVRKAPHAPPNRLALQSRAARAAAAQPPKAAKAAPPAPAKPAAKAGQSKRRRALLDAVAADGLAARSTTAKPAAATKRPAPVKPAATAKTPVPLPAPRQTPARVVIGFPKLPTQIRAVRYEGPHELQALLGRYRKFLSVASMVAEARRLSDDERHQVEVARARVAEIKQLAWSNVR